jgi:hypothetical protein
MTLLERFTNPNWFVLPLIFIGVLLYLAIMRQRESRRILEKFKKSDIIITSFGVNYFGLESEPGGPLRSSGALVLLKNGLYYRARFRRRELFIPGPAITYIGVSDGHKGRALHQQVVVIQFLNPGGREERAAFRMAYPAQWVGAIKANLLSDQPKPPKRSRKQG